MIFKSPAELLYFWSKYHNIVYSIETQFFNFGISLSLILLRDFLIKLYIYTQQTQNANFRHPVDMMSPSRHN